MIRRLTRLQRITLILFLIVVTNWFMLSTTGYSLLGGDLFTFFFIGFLTLSSVTLAFSLMRKWLGGPRSTNPLARSFKR
jgi:hypothetical protein